MPEYQPGSEKKYFPAVVAALIVIGVVVATFVYNLIFASDGLVVKKELGINPSTTNTSFPSGDPVVSQPINPP